MSEAFEFRRLRLRGDDPPHGRLLVRWRLRLKELPGLPVRAEFPQLHLVKLRGFALFVRVDSRSIFRTGLERLEAGRLHAPLCAEFIDAFPLSIDPSKAQRFVDRFRPRDTRLT